jgi:hypothetical protein
MRRAGDRSRLRSRVRYDLADAGRNDGSQHGTVDPRARVQHRAGPARPLGAPPPRHLRGSPHRQASDAIADRADVPASLRPRVRVTRRRGTDPRPRFDSAMQISNSECTTGDRVLESREKSLLACGKVAIRQSSVASNWAAVAFSSPIQGPAHQKLSSPRRAANPAAMRHRLDCLELALGEGALRPQRDFLELLDEFRR